MRTILNDFLIVLVESLYSLFWRVLEAISYPVQEAIIYLLELLLMNFGLHDYTGLLQWTFMLDEFFPVQYALTLFNTYITFWITCLIVRFVIKLATLGQA